MTPRARHADILTASDVADLFRVDIKTVSRWANAGKLRESFRTPGGHRRWARADVEAAMEKLRAKSW